MDSEFYILSGPWTTLQPKYMPNIGHDLLLVVNTRWSSMTNIDIIISNCSSSQSYRFNISNNWYLSITLWASDSDINYMILNIYSI